MNFFFFFPFLVVNDSKYSINTYILYPQIQSEKGSLGDFSSNETKYIQHERDISKSENTYLLYNRQL